ncbi:MAG: SDR family oxidoreductase [Selenomonadaceae bacterium]|nr:SDR family oxidoreductase [Selenomonadaceae bacterium]
MGSGYVLVTGATSGIGEALARILLTAGVPVVACGRNRKQLDSIIKFGKGIAIPYLYDLMDTGCLERHFATFLQAHNVEIRGFVHCAGVYPIVPIRMMSDADAHKVMDVNLFSAMALLSAMMKKRVNHGMLESVVMVSSTSSIRGTQGMTAYCASKAAIEGFVRAAAVELAPHVRINAVRPGAIPTEGGRALSEGAQDMLTHPRDYGYLLGNGSIDDVVSMIRYLLSDQARWITGQCFTVDGGLSAH